MPKKLKKYIGVLSAYGDVSIIHCVAKDFDEAYSTLDDCNVGTLLVMDMIGAKSLIKLLQKQIRKNNE